MTLGIAVVLAFGAGIFAGYGLAFLYIRIRDRQHPDLKRRDPGLEFVDPHPHG